MPILQQAKQININLSQMLEQHLTKIIRQAQRSLWLEKTRMRWMNTTVASNRAAHSATAFGGFDDAD
jgi:post-segregation antitoxin (ccd killing protein)